MVEAIQFKYSMKKICSILANILNNIIKTNEKERNENLSSIFIGEVSEDFTIEKYLLRIVGLTKLNKATLVYAFALADLFCNNGKQALSANTSFKIILIAIVTSIKFNEDIILTDSDLAFVGGISLLELNYLEREFLTAINYKVMLSNEVFKMYAKPFIY
jgi:elongation factor P--beta-lysine ligase